MKEQVVLKEVRQGNLKFLLTDQCQVIVKSFIPERGTESTLYVVRPLNVKIHAEAGFEPFIRIIESQEWISLQEAKAMSRTAGYAESQVEREQRRAEKTALAAIEKLKALGLDAGDIFKRLAEGKAA